MKTYHACLIVLVAIATANSPQCANTQPRIAKKLKTWIKHNKWKVITASAAAIAFIGTTAWYIRNNKIQALKHQADLFAALKNELNTPSEQKTVGSNPGPNSATPWSPDPRLADLLAALKNELNTPSGPSSATPWAPDPRLLAILSPEDQKKAVEKLRDEWRAFMSKKDFFSIMGCKEVYTNAFIHASDSQIEESNIPSTKEQLDGFIQTSFFPNG